MDSRLIDDDLIPLSKSESLTSLKVEGEITGSFLSSFGGSNLRDLSIISEELQASTLASLGSTSLEYLSVTCKPSEISINELPRNIRRIVIFYDLPLDQKDRSWLKAAMEKNSVIYADVHPLSKIAEYL